MTEAFEGLENVDCFNVVRRQETINNFGRSTLTQFSFPGIIGTVYPAGPNALDRGPDEQHTVKNIQIVTRFRLQMASPGYQADIVQWGGDSFLVINAQDFSHFGGGMIVADCSSIDSVDQAPGYDWAVVVPPPPSPRPPITRIALGNLTVYTLPPPPLQDGTQVWIRDNKYTAQTVQPKIVGSFDNGMTEYQFSVNGESIICVWDASSSAWGIF